MQGNFPSVWADMVYSEGNMKEGTLSRRYNLTEPGPRSRPPSPPSQFRPTFEMYPIGSSTGFPPTIHVARASSPPLNQPFFEQDLGSSATIEISDGAGSPKPTPMMGQRMLKLLSTKVGTMGSILNRSEDFRSEKDVESREDLRQTINHLSEQEPLPFYAKYRFWVRGFFYFWAFAAIYILLVEHTFFHTRNHHVFPDNLNKITIIISTKDYWSPAPTKLETSQCILRLLNSCTDASLDCSRKTMVGYGEYKMKISSGGESAELEAFSNTRYNLLPESWHNKLFCEFMFIIPPSVGVEVMGDKMYIIAEDMAIKSLYVSGKSRDSNALNLHLSLVRVSVSESLTFFGGTGGVILGDIVVGSSLIGDVIGGSIDITTEQAPGAFTVATESRTACIVGADTKSLTSSVIAESNGTAFEVVKGSFGCVGACPTYNLKARGRGSVGVHWSGAPSLDVFAGQGFQGRNYYSAVDHSEITSGSASYVYIGVSGLGLMKGGNEIVWTNNRVWWSFNSEVTFFAAFSLFVVMPDMSRYKMVTSFCPAHSGASGPAKNMFLPLEEGMAGAADKKGNKGYWLYRNTGALRDSVKSNIERVFEFNFLSKAEKYIPYCDYCGDYNYWKDGYYTGAIGDPVKEAPRKCVGIPIEACTPQYKLLDDSCSFYNANQWTLVEKGEVNCIPGDTVGSLTSNDNIVFPDYHPKCWTSAKGSCAGVRDAFKVWTSIILFYLSVIISVVIALFVTGGVASVFFKEKVCTSMLGLLVSHRRTFGHIKKTLNQSKYFAVEEPIPEDKLDSTHGRLLRHVDMTKLSVLFFKECSPLSWLFQGTWPIWKDIKRGWIPIAQEATAQNFVSPTFVKVCRWLLQLQVDPETMVIIDPAGIFSPGSRLVYLPDMTSHEFLSIAEEHADDAGEKYTLHTIENNPAICLQKFEAYREDIRQVMFVMQNLIVTFSIWFLTERPMLGVPVQQVDPKIIDQNPPYFTLARELYYNRVRSFLGEMQTLVVHFMFPFIPSLFFYTFCLSWFYIRAAEYGVTDLYPGSTNYYVQEVASDLVVCFCFFFWLSLMIYYGPAWNDSDWNLPIRTGEESESEAKKRKRTGCCSGSNKKDENLSKADQLLLTFQRFDKRYTWLNRERRGIFAWFYLCLSASIFYISMIAVWLMLGLFLDPQRVAPFAIGILAVSTHVFSLYYIKVEKLEEISQNLKKQMIDFNLDDIGRQKDMIQVKGHVISSNQHIMNTVQLRDELNMAYTQVTQKEAENLEKTADLEVITWLRRFNVTGAKMFAEIFLSTLLLLGVFLFLYVGMEVFRIDKTDTIQAVVNSAVIIVATYGVNRRSAGNDSKIKVDQQVARIMAAYKMDRSTGGFAVDLHEKVSIMMTRADQQSLFLVDLKKGV